MRIHKAVPAVAAALLFGAGMPFAKLLIGDVEPLLLAGLLYLGSGAGLGLVVLVRCVAGRDDTAAPTPLRIPRRDVPYLVGAVVAGGIAGPALLMAGLARTGAASAALLLNLEGVATALIAWLVYGEHADRRIVLGMLAIVAGGVLLAWQPGGAVFAPGALFVAAACVCWAVDNNLTRDVAANDAVLVAALKGGVAGAVNTGLGLASGAAWPPAAALGWALLVGFAGYGVSLAFFVRSLRTLGTARTAAYFSVAPLFGVAVSLLVWPEWPTPAFCIAAALMGVGIWLHLRERHAHEHRHEPLAHLHRHRHDDPHHAHDHDFAWDGKSPHVHPHEHAALVHTHAHDPDIHHRHRH